MVHLFDTQIPIDSINRINEVLHSGYLSEGDVVENFEESIKYNFNFKNFTAVNSGTSALHLALKLAGIKRGDEVILPAQTFVATGMAILYCGGIPVFADVNKFGLLDIASVMEKRTPKTKAVIMVHWGGLPCDINYINEISHAMGWITIEDAAQALGAKYKDEYIGKHDSDFVCFSFQATKHLTTGDGGGLVCASGKDYKRAREMRWFGIDRQNDKPDTTGERAYNLYEEGYKYNMNNLSAAIGLGQMNSINAKIIHNKITAHYYDNSLRNNIDTRYKQESSYWFYPALVNERDLLIKTLYEKGYESSVVHQGIDRNLIFGGLNRSLYGQREFEKHFIALPIHVNFFQLEEICSTILEHEKKYGKFIGL